MARRANGPGHRCAAASRASSAAVEWHSRSTVVSTVTGSDGEVVTDDKGRRNASLPAAMGTVSATMARSPLDEQIARLQAISTSPHAPEPPARSLAVEAMMRLVTHTGVRLETPHLHGGTDAEKVEYEYRFANSFWEVLQGVAGPEALAGKRVLDVGCGWGGKDLQYAETLGLAGIVGFDLPGIYKPEVTQAEARARGLDTCTIMTGDAEDMPVDDASCARAEDAISESVTNRKPSPLSSPTPAAIVPMSRSPLVCPIKTKQSSTSPLGGDGGTRARAHARGMTQLSGRRAHPRRARPS